MHFRGAGGPEGARPAEALASMDSTRVRSEYRGFGGRERVGVCRFSRLHSGAPELVLAWEVAYVASAAAFAAEKSNRAGRSFRGPGWVAPGARGLQHESRASLSLRFEQELGGHFSSSNGLLFQ